MLNVHKRKLKIELEEQVVLRINPLEAHSRLLLNELLSSNRAVLVFKKNQSYQLSEGREARLTNTLVVRDLLGSRAELCYFVLSNHLFPAASCAIIYELEGVITFHLEAQNFAYRTLPPALGTWIFKEFGDKVPFYPATRKKFLSLIEKESDLSQRLPHLRASPMFGGDDRQYIMINKFTGTELFDVINLDGADSLTLPQRLELSFLLIQALKNQIHDYGLVHCDIKPENIIVDRSVTPIKINIIDVAYAREEGSLFDGEFRGTQGYIAPESGIKGEPVTFKTDVFALGRTLQLLFGFYKWHPHHDRDCDLTEELNVKSRSLLLSTLTACIHPDPKQRSTLEKLEVKFTQLLEKEVPNSSALNHGSIPSVQVDTSPLLNGSSQVNLTPFHFFAPKTHTSLSLLDNAHGMHSAASASSRVV